jgi:nucleoside-diphosphate-sugar epimerase
MACTKTLDTTRSSFWVATRSLAERRYRDLVEVAPHFHDGDCRSHGDQQDGEASYVALSRLSVVVDLRGWLDQHVTDPYVIVVGATGWVGRRLVSRAEERGLFGAAVSRRGEPVLSWEGHPVGDVAKLATRSGAVVVNAAGASSGKRRTLRRANVELVERLARTCQEVGAGLVTLGSAAEYGAPFGPLASESDLPRPTSPYGRSKLAATQMVLRYVDAGLRATVLRVFNLVGADRPGVDPISDFARAVKALPVSGGVVHPYDSSLVRDLTGLDRAADLVLDFCEHVGEAPLVNLCSGRGVSFHDLIKAMAEARGVSAQVQDSNPGGVPRVVGDPRVLFRLVGVREPQSVTELARLALGIT